MDSLDIIKQRRKTLSLSQQDLAEMAGTKMLMEDFASVIGRSELSDGKAFKYSGCYGDIAAATRRFRTIRRADRSGDVTLRQDP